MIFVVAPGTGEYVPPAVVRRMRLPIRHGWDGWIFRDPVTGRTRRFASYRSLLIHLKIHFPPVPEAGFFLPEETECTST